MTKTHPNQSVDTLISVIILSSIWQFAAFVYVQAVRKVALLSPLRLYSKRGLLRSLDFIIKSLWLRIQRSKVRFLMGIFFRIFSFSHARYRQKHLHFCTCVCMLYQIVLEELCRPFLYKTHCRIAVR